MRHLMDVGKMTIFSGRKREMTALFVEAEIVAIGSFISPYERGRRQARIAVGDNFHEIYLKADLTVCEERAPKGLYAKARGGEILDFTGVSAPYEAPEAPELLVDTSVLSIDESLNIIADYVEHNVVL